MSDVTTLHHGRGGNVAGGAGGTELDAGCRPVWQASQPVCRYTALLGFGALVTREGLCADRDMSAACRQISLPARLPTQQDVDGGLATNAAGLSGVFDTIMESPDRPLNPRAAAALSGGGRLVQHTESLPAVSPLRCNGFDADLRGASPQRSALLPTRTARTLCWQTMTHLHSNVGEARVDRSKARYWRTAVHW